MRQAPHAEFSLSLHMMSLRARVTLPPSVLVSALLSPSVRVTETGTSTEAQSSAPELMGESCTCVMPHTDVRGPKAGCVSSV